MIPLILSEHINNQRGGEMMKADVSRDGIYGSLKDEGSLFLSQSAFVTCCRKAKGVVKRGKYRRVPLSAPYIK